MVQFFCVNFVSLSINIDIYILRYLKRGKITKEGITFYRSKLVKSHVNFFHRRNVNSPKLNYLFYQKI